MQLKFFGKGSAFYPTFGNTCAYFTKKDDLFLLDCGLTAFEQLFKTFDLKKVENIYVLITHLHADHIGSLGSLIAYFQCVLNKPVHIIHPETTIVDLLTLEGIDEIGYIHHKSMPENAADVKAEAIEVVHAKNMKCYGYLLRDAEKSIFYSGDTATIPQRILNDFLEDRIEEVYHDTCLHESSDHCFYKILEKNIPLNKRSRVFCMHLSGPYEELLKKQGFRIVEVIE